MIGDLIAGALPLLQQQAESMMTDTCVITRITGETLDPETDLLVPVLEQVYTGPCRLRFEMNRVQPRETEGQLLVARQSMLFLPYATSGGLKVNDRATLAGAAVTVRIAGLFSQTYATARRFPVEALS